MKKARVCDYTAGGGGRGVCAVAFGVAWRFRFNGLVDGSFEVGFVAFVEGFGADEFSVAERGREVT